MSHSSLALPSKKKKYTYERTAIYGNTAVYLGKRHQQETGNTHRWTCYVRGQYDEDISYFVKKVQFTFHPSCNPPSIVVEEPPFEVTQDGWGEFDVRMRLYFQNDGERPVDLHHALCLFSSEGGLSSKKIEVRSENKTVLAFKNPSSDFARRLQKNGRTGGDTDTEIGLLKRAVRAVDNEHDRLITEFEVLRKKAAKLRSEVQLTPNEGQLRSPKA